MRCLSCSAYAGVLLDDLVDVDRLAVVDLDQDLVLLLQGALELLPEDRQVEQVLHADADAGDLVAVGGADAAAGGADLALAQEPLGDLIQGPVVRHDQVRVGGDHQPRGVHPALLQAGELADQHLGVDDDAVADHRRAAGRQDPRRDQVQRVLLAVRRDHRVAGVVAALVADDVGHAATEQVGGLALALVAPLGADQHDSRHRVLVLLGRRIGDPAGSRGGRSDGRVSAWPPSSWTSAVWSPARPPAGATSPPPRTPSRSSSGGRSRRSPRVLTALLKADRTALVPVAWEPAGDKDSLALARDIGVGTGEPRDLCLVRDDHGGVLLHHGRIEAAGDGRRSLSRRLGPAGPPRRHQGRRRRDHPDRRAPRLAGGGHHRRDRDDPAAAADPAHQRAGPAGGLATRRGSSATASPTRARSTAGPGTPTTGCAGACSPEPVRVDRRPSRRVAARAPVVDTGAHPARRGGPAAVVLCPDRAPAALACR